MRDLLKTHILSQIKNVHKRDLGEVKKQRNGRRMVGQSLAIMDRACNPHVSFLAFFSHHFSFTILLELDDKVIEIIKDKAFSCKVRTLEFLQTLNLWTLLLNAMVLE
jgi:hypothetical protein